MRLAQAFVIITFFSSTWVHSQGKKTIDLESELSGDEEPGDQPKGEIKDKKVIVEGEDEQLIHGKKKDGTSLAPSGSKTIEWEQAADQIVRKEKRGAKEVEKRAQVKAEYGSYNSLGVDIYITKRDKDGIYLLEYNREKSDSEGFGRDTLSTSDHSIDNLKLVSGFNINEAYKLLIKTSYQDNLYGLQNNSTYEQQFKRGGIVDVQNQFRTSENQKLDLILQGTYVGSNVEDAAGARLGSAFGKTQGEVNWQYILGPRNALAAGARLWYGENEIYSSSQKMFYRAGTAHISDIFTAYRGHVGEEKVLWQLDMRVGFRIFFANSMLPVMGLFGAIDSYYGSWHSRLSADRKAYIPDTVDTFLQKPYLKPQQYLAPEEKWEFWWKNSFKLNKQMALKAHAGFEMYDTFYEPTQDIDELYTYSAQRFHVAIGRAAWEHNLRKDLYYETGLKAERHLDDVNLRTPLSGFVKGHFLPGKWDFGLEVEFIGTRKLEASSLDPYFILNASIERQINNTINFFVRGENLFNENYLQTPPYKTSGLKAFGGIFVFL